MVYSREELDWIEAEWAFHLHGRSAFLSREDFLQAEAWAREGVPAEALVAAMGAYFERRAKRARPRSFVALSHLERDVRKATRLREALKRAEDDGPAPAGWEGISEPLRSSLEARAAFEAWRRLQASAPAPDSPAFLDHFDAQRQAFRALMALAEQTLGPGAEARRAELRARLAEAGIPEGGPVWKRAWEHHWNRALCEAWRIPE